MRVEVARASSTEDVGRRECGIGKPVGNVVLRSCDIDHFVLRSETRVMPPCQFVSFQFHICTVVEL